MSKSPLRSDASPLRRAISRHLEGWQPAALAVLLAGAMALLVVPRPVEPVELPAPRFDARAVARVIAEDDKLAAAAEREDLDVDVRQLGSIVREYGRADAEGDEGRLLLARRRAAEASARALELGEAPALRLRAYQMRAFLREVARFSATGVESEDLRELGGPFVAMLRRSGWVDERRGRRILVDGVALRVLFKRRWNEVTAIPRGRLEPSLDEQRVFYAFLLEHPASGPAAFAVPDPRNPGAAAARRANEEQYRLKKIDELSAIDPSYPSLLARGIVHYRQERFHLAAKEFDQYLEAAPDGPFTLRVQNYLRAAVGRAKQEQF